MFPYSAVNPNTKRAAVKNKYSNDPLVHTRALTQVCVCVCVCVRWRSSGSRGDDPVFTVTHQLRDKQTNATERKQIGVSAVDMQGRRGRASLKAADKCRARQRQREGWRDRGEEKTRGRERSDADGRPERA